MKKLSLSILMAALLSISVGAQARDYEHRSSNKAEYREDRRDDRQDYRDDRRDDRDDRRDDRQDYRDDRRDDRRYQHRGGRRLIVVAPRHRHFRGVVVVRTYGHSYHGYGYHVHDDDAWKWLSFTAITLKLLDNLNEQAQREHEAAQIKATTAPVGEKVVWSDGDSSGHVTTVKEGKSAETGLTCREFQQSITVGGKTEEAYGTACLQPDGAWKIVS